MINFNIGDTLKIIGENRVIKVAGITVVETATIPSGWIITDSGSFVNPRICEHYKGAMSVLGGGGRLGGGTIDLEELIKLSPS